ncbi:peritrophin-1-like [Arctopsyche grandis]|uniref:peritrophin-1-like n=1 Tax=Arctopsyche grandis TaxID=121162 RepID=UPI00406D707A
MKGLSILAVFTVLGVACVLADIPKCPPFNPADPVVLLPNVDDCSTFFICDQSNVAVLRPCFAGLWFNPAAGVCDFPVNIEEGVCIPPVLTTTDATTGTNPEMMTV